MQAGIEMATVSCVNPNKEDSKKKKKKIMVPRKIIATELGENGRVITPEVPFLKIN